MNIVRDIQSLSIFKRDASKIIKQIKATKQPVILTVNGVADAVVLDAESYQNLRFTFVPARFEGTLTIKDDHYV